MAFQVSTPDKFNFKPEEWGRWIRRFERFRIASKLNGESEEAQVNTLIYSMGDEADDILAALKLTTDERKSYKTVKEKLDNHFVIKRNVIYERAKFNMRMQRNGEPVDNFITDSAWQNIVDLETFMMNSLGTELLWDYQIEAYQKDCSWKQT